MNTRFSLPVFALLALLTLSCTKEPGHENENPAGNSQDKVVFTAKIPSTKALVDNNGIVSWSLDDRIGVYDGRTYQLADVVKLFDDMIRFEAPVDPNAEQYIAVCPYEMGLVDGEFRIDADGNVQLSYGTAVQDTGGHILSVAHSSSANEIMDFKNVCNVLSYDIQVAGVAKVALTAYDDALEPTDFISGPMTVNPATGDFVGESFNINEIVAEAKTGQNVIAVPQGVKFEDGFTLTFWADDAREEYIGEVNWGIPLDSEAGDRNVMYQLGIIDERYFDRYGLWENGKTLTIDGVEYSKASTSLNGCLVRAAGGETIGIADEIDPENKKVIRDCAVFLDVAQGGKIVMPNNGIDIKGTVLMFGRYDIVRPTLSLTSRQTSNINLVSADGTLRCKGIHFDQTAYTPVSSEDYPKAVFRPYTNLFGTLLADDCKFTIPTGANVVLWDNPGQDAVKTIKFCNSEFESKRTDGRIEILRVVSLDPVAGSSVRQAGHFENIQSLIFHNNVFYNTTPTCGVTLFALPVQDNALPTRTQATQLTIERNTFYNMPTTDNTYFMAHGLALTNGLRIVNNIFHNSTTDATANHMVYLQGTTKLTTFNINENLNVNITTLYYFNPSQGAYAGSTSKLSPVTTNVFVSSNPIAAKDFTVKAAYSQYGAQNVNCR